jgi:hypothetical protein
MTALHDVEGLRRPKCHPVRKIFFSPRLVEHLTFLALTDFVVCGLRLAERDTLCAWSNETANSAQTMLKGSFVHKIWEGKKIAHWDSRRSLAYFALSLGLLFTGSSGAISAQAEVRNKQREAHKRRPEKEREGHKRRSEKEHEGHKRRSEKERNTRKRGRGNGLSSLRGRAESEKETETRNRAFETERDGRTRYLEWRHDDLKRDAESGREARKRYEETRREAIKRRREWIREENAKRSLFPRQPERREREGFPILPKDAKQSLFLQRPETFKRKREWIKEARKLR